MDDQLRHAGLNPSGEHNVVTMWLSVQWDALTRFWGRLGGLLVFSQLSTPSATVEASQ